MSAAQRPTVDSSDAGGKRRATEKVLKAFHEEGTLKDVPDARLLMSMWPYVRPYRGLFYLSLALVLVNSGLAMARPLIMKVTIDQGVQAGDSWILMKGGLAFAGIIIVEQVLTFIQMYSVQIVGARAMADLRVRVFEFLHGMRLGYFDRQPIGRLVTRCTNDVDAVQELFASGAFNAVGDLVRLIGIVALMLALDWQLALIAFAAVPPVVLLVRYVRGKLRESFREIRSSTARMNASMNEQVTGLAVVQAYARESASAADFERINEDYKVANLKNIQYDAIQDAAIDMMKAIALALIIVSLGYRPVSFGILVAFNAYLVQFFEPISMLAQRYTLLQSAMAGAERVNYLLEQEEADAPVLEETAAPPGDASHAFAFEDVTFGYKPGSTVLRNVSFNARRGEKIALVGPTGAGKTTVSALLLRLYEVGEGVVRVDGQDVRGLERSDLRRRFAVVPQDVFLFPGSIATNVAASPEPDMGRVRDALARVGALEVFEKRAGGLEGAVGEQGSNFSAGERQLIAFARAIYRDADILILDEATASVDSDTEARLQKALDEVMRDRTALIIAHRLSTIRRADRILVFHKGQVAEQGTHDELLQTGGLYARLHELQFARAAE